MWGGVPLAMAPIIANGSLMGESSPSPSSPRCVQCSLSLLSHSLFFPSFTFTTPQFSYFRHNICSSSSFHTKLLFAILSLCMFPLFRIFFSYISRFYTFLHSFLSIGHHLKNNLRITGGETTFFFSFWFLLYSLP